MPNHLHLLIEPLPQNVNLESMDLPGDWPPRFFRPEVRKTWQKQCLLKELQWAPLAPIMKAIKSVTALEINKKYKLTGAAWHRESFDHWVRNAEEYCRIIDYIDQNPVRAGLCQKPDQWYRSSCGEKRD